MSDELDIRGGGVVAVDTTTLRTAAGGFDGLAGELSEIATLVGSTGSRLFELSPATWDASATIEAVRRRILTVIEDADGIADALRLAADVYDIVELRSERAAAQAAGDEAARRDWTHGSPRPSAPTPKPIGRRARRARALVRLAGRARAAIPRNAVVARSRRPLARDPVRLVGAAGDRRERSRHHPVDSRPAR